MDWKASGTGGAVAAGGEKAVEAGITMLERRGNAADAAAATILALSITDYGFFAIGGEVPFMIYDAHEGAVKVLCGLGCAPRDPKAIEWYYQHGIPGKGGMKAAPVPGAVGLCLTALRLFGTTSFEQAVAPSVAMLDVGREPWHRPLAMTFRRLVDAERAAAGGREEGLALAEERFYRGDIAEELEAFYVRDGGFLRKADLASHQTRLEDPVTIRYRGWRIYKCGPWTQGPYLCQTLRLLEGFDLRRMGHLSADYVHALAEAMKLALADRDQYYGDPLFVDVPLAQLLSDEYTELRRPLIDMQRASTDFRPGDPLEMRPVGPAGGSEPARGGTTTCVAADRWGNVVAATPSANGPYSVCEELGISHGNRLRCLNTTPGHPNRIEAGKRPRITLTPTLATREGAVVAISVAGGDLQDQTTLNCLLNHIEFGMSAEDAVSAPRFSTGHHQNSFNPDPDRGRTIVARGQLTADARIGGREQEELARRGHRVATTDGAIARPVMIVLDRGAGTVHAAGDPRAERHAAALPG